MLREEVLESIRSTFELYGYSPIETPALERFEVLSSKFAGGGEILNETYQLEDQGKRKLGLRYDLTVPLCRIVARNYSSIQKPFKRYQIASVWRDGPLKKGRYREFVQCDADVIGEEGMQCEAELISMCVDSLKGTGLKDFKVKINNRKLLDGVLESEGVSEEKWNPFLLCVDKLEKIGELAVLSDIAVKKIASEEKARRVLKKLKEKSLAAFKNIPSEKGREGVMELEQLFDLLKQYDIQEYAEFDPSLARGLNYYTGTVFEAYLSGFNSSLAGGGRYDDLIGKFMSSEEEIPAVGISLGLDVIIEVMDGKGRSTVCDCILIPIGEVKVIAIANNLRSMGVKTMLSFSNKVGKSLEYASKLGIPFAVIIGEREVKEGKVKLRDLKNGEEKILSLEAVAIEMRKTSF